MKKTLLVLALLLFVPFIFGGKMERFTVTSKAFSNGGEIPSEYTCDSINISPDISWIGAPKNTVSFLLICDDPDIPVKTKVMQEWVHWVMYNIPVDVKSIAKSQVKLSVLPWGARQGKNDSKSSGYSGPCPPNGEHRYFFRVYALDCMLDIDPSKATKRAVLDMAKGHILGSGELMGKYKRKKQ